MRAQIDLAKLSILKYPDPRLRQAGQPVEEFSDDLGRLIERMLDIMRQANGVGLAAPQLGIRKRIFVCNHSGKPQDDMVFINPEVADLQDSIQAEEGCLSIPEVSVPIRRARSCVIKAQDPRGHAIQHHGEELLARVWQHETDHLNGRLILDYMDESSKLANRTALKYLEETYKQH